MSQTIIKTNIPNYQAIELVEYYDEFAWYYPECEMQTKGWCVENFKDEWTIIDCGANIGYFSILFSKLSPNGKVYAFEPTSTYDKLLANIAHHNCRNIEPIKMAVGEKSGEISDEIYRIWGNEPERQKYPFTTLDDFVQEKELSKIDLIKIDVDSFDFEVLKGAKHILAKFNPIVIVELNHALSKRNQTNTEALKWLIDIGYREAVVMDLDNFILKKDSELHKNYKDDKSIKLYIL